MNNINNLLSMCSYFYALAKEEHILLKNIPNAAKEIDHPLHGDWLMRNREQSKERLEKLHQDPIAWDNYLKKQNQRIKDFYKKKQEIDPEEYAKMVEKRRKAEAERVKDAIKSNTLDGLMVKLRLQLADRVRTLKKYNVTDEYNEFSLFLKTINILRERINDYLGNYVDGKYNTSKEDLEKTTGLCNSIIAHMKTNFPTAKALISTLAQMALKLHEAIDTLNLRQTINF